MNEKTGIIFFAYIVAFMYSGVIFSGCHSKKEESKFIIYTSAACTAIAEIMLVTAMLGRFSFDFYVVLRITVCAAMIYYVLYFQHFFKHVASLGALLFNPVIPIYIGDRDVWLIFDVIAIIVLLAFEIFTVVENIKFARESK